MVFQLLRYSLPKVTHINGAKSLVQLAKKLTLHEAEACGVLARGSPLLAKKFKVHEAKACGVWHYAACHKLARKLKRHEAWGTTRLKRCSALQVVNSSVKLRAVGAPSFS